MRFFGGCSQSCVYRLAFSLLIVLESTELLALSQRILSREEILETSTNYCGIEISSFVTELKKEQVHSIYQIKVIECLKGSYKPGDELQLTVLGGEALRDPKNPQSERIVTRIIGGPELKTGQKILASFVCEGKPARCQLENWQFKELVEESGELYVNEPNTSNPSIKKSLKSSIKSASRKSWKEFRSDVQMQLRNP